MKKLGRYLFWFCAVAVILAGALAGGGYLWLRTQLPAQEGLETVAGLGAAARISRDRDGLVFIRAESEADAYFALGYAHAQDRLWQMEATRRIGAGRLAELGGARFLEMDRAMRRLGIYRLAEAAVAGLAPEARAALDAYVRGVNAWIGRAGADAAPEFRFFAIAPERWRAADSLVWGRLMALRLSGRWESEYARAAVAARLPEGDVKRLFPGDPPDAPVTMPTPVPKRQGAQEPARHAASLPTRAQARQLMAAIDAVLPPALRPPSETASNAWAVAGARTESGKPVMANDPHLGLRLPNIWYLARIDVPGLSLAGATAPGVPFHVIGHNGRIAWGMTTTGADTQDVVRETEAPEPDQYLTPSGPQPFERRDEVIRVRGSDPVTLTVRRTRNGPVVADDPESEGILTLRVAALRPDDGTANALYRINRARNWRDFTAAIEDFHSPVQNLMYADTDGHIGFSVAGRIPIPGPGAKTGLLDGRRADHDWRGFVPAGELPRVLDPERGIIVNANNRVAGPDYPHYLSDRWDEPFRAMRAEALLAGEGRHGPAASRRMQMDAVSIPARRLAPLFLRMTPARERHRAAREVLEGWNGAAPRGETAPLIFNAWFAHASALIFEDELEAAAGFLVQRAGVLERVLREDSAWCDDKTTPASAETCAQILERGLDAALADLGRRFGGGPRDWKWGDAHVARLDNQALGWIPLVGRLSQVNIPTDGDNFTLNRGTSALRRRGLDAGAPFRHVHGPVLRAVFDLADLDASTFAMPGGQSGHFLSPHYADLTERWRDGETVRLPASPTSPVRTLTLRPAPGGGGGHP